MSQSDDTSPDGIRDEDLPEDLQPGEDNPLAEPLDTDEVDVEDLDMEGGKQATESEDAPDEEDAAEGRSAADEEE